MPLKGWKIRREIYPRNYSRGLFSATAKISPRWYAMASLTMAITLVKTQKWEKGTTYYEIINDYRTSQNLVGMQ